MAAAHCTNEATSLIVPQGWPIAKKREIVIRAISQELAERIANQGVHRSSAPRSNVTVSAREVGPETGESTCPHELLRRAVQPSHPRHIRSLHCLHDLII